MPIDRSKWRTCDLCDQAHSVPPWGLSVICTPCWIAHGENDLAWQMIVHKRFLEIRSQHLTAENVK